jgi:hypothetical protein
MVSPAYNSTQLLKNIRLDQLDIKNGEISGDLISGGTITNFASTGIDDKSTVKTLTILDNRIVVDTITVRELNGNFHVAGNMGVGGTLTVGTLKAIEILSDRTFDKMYLEFQAVDEAVNPNGSGLIWKGRDYTKQFTLKANPDRFLSSESIDIFPDKSYKIDNVEVLSKDRLGTGVSKSSLREVGVLKRLQVTGDVDLAEFIKISSDQQRIGINTEQLIGTITISDIFQDVILNLDIENGRGKFGTFNNRPIDFVAGDSVLLTLDPKGSVTLGHEYKTDNEIRVYGKLGINVKHPEAELDIRGGIRFGGKLFIADNSPPEKGNYKRGDIVWNTVPTEGSPIGWVCTVSGNPGIWHQFGLLG